MSSGFFFEKANKEQFAVFQTIYSNVDIEMWYDWRRRLEDTMWTDNCYWIMADGAKIAGVIINDSTAIYPFLISPFCDRVLFWRLIHKHLTQLDNEEIHINGVLDDDVRILLTFGYRIDRMRQVMCRPTECYSLELPDRYYGRPPDPDTDVTAITQALSAGYTGGIDYQVFGTPTMDEVATDARQLMGSYLETNTLEQSVLVFDKATNKIAGLCIAGIDPNMPNGFAGIAEICVLPEHRHQGVAEFMLKYSMTTAHKAAPVMKLCVTVGNSAESLYRRLGFVAGPRFANMTSKR